MIPIAFDEDNINHINKNNICWTKIIERSIYSKVEHIFKALKWDITEIKPKKERTKKKCITS